MSLASYQAAPPRVPEGRHYGHGIQRAQEDLSREKGGDRQRPPPHAQKVIAHADIPAIISPVVGA